MPPDSGMGFVVVLHLPADRRSILPEILSRWTSMRIVEATEGCLVEANCIYVPPPGVAVLLRDGRLHLHARASDAPREPSPISMFFDSLAAALHEDAIGVILSGTGNDGALGLKAIKTCGGLTLAQGADGSRPQHDGMPASAIATGAVDIVVPVEAMPARIMAVQEARRTDDTRPGALADQLKAARLAICAVLHRQVGHDFSGYKEKTFLRRVQRRMQVLALTTLDAYVARLEADPAEVAMLLQDLLIGVTGFFRDAETFEALRRSVAPQLFHDKGMYGTIRVWVPGCATGEEAYSLAMLLCEYTDTLKGEVPKLQIFATDIDEAAIATARAGRYPPTLLQELSPERLSRFFVSDADGSYTVAKEMRALCTFSAHSLTRDPPFSRIDLISCRNLLICLDSDLQAAVIPAFHYSLVPGGILLLGSLGAISRHENLFVPLDKAHRIFQRREGPAAPLQLTGEGGVHQTEPATGRSFGTQDTARTPTSRITSRASARVLDRFAPAFVVVNADGEIVQYSSRTGRYLEPPSGQPSQNVLVIARRGLGAPLRAALRQAAETGRAVEKPGVSVAVPGEGAQRITLAVEPISEPGAGRFYIIVFVATDLARADDDARHAADAAPDIGVDRHLETEPRDTREQLQSGTEEHETALEELHSVNEELQSTNEELKTSKEEIQSINEELQTVNVQLAGKVEELDHKNSDLQNLFESTQVATIFLDPYLVIRGFTPAVASIYNLIPSDQGRPLTDIVSRLRYTQLREDVRQVLDTLEPLERRVGCKDGRTHYLMRILPYRTPDSTVDGTIMTFVDVSSIVQAEQHQRLLVDELNHRVKNMLAVVVSLATQTLRGARTLQEFSDNYLGRIDALSRAYSLLSNEAWQTVSLRDVVMEELGPFVAGDQANIVLEGPPVSLEPRASLAFGMAIHELTTNAVKYGALSVPEGTIGVKWGLEPGTDGDQLVLEWAERGGPPVVVPVRHGFGMKLIERGLKQDMSAEVRMEFAVEGVRATLRGPLRTEATVRAADRPGA